MWPSESASRLQLRQMPFTSDESTESETAELCVEPRCRNVTDVEAVEWQTSAIDSDSGVNGHPTWFQAHDEMDLSSGTVHREDFDELTIEDETHHPQYDPVNSYVDSLTEWMQQQLSGTSSQSEHHHRRQHQQHCHQQVSSAEWDNAASGTAATESNKQPSQVTTQNCSGALTAEDLRVLSGSGPCLLTYRGRRLRHIAPRPTSWTTRYVQSTQPQQSLPKTTFSIVIGRPSVTTATTSTVSHSTISVNPLECNGN